MASAAAAALELALAAFAERRLADSSAHCRRVVELDPKNAAAWNLLGLTLLHLGQPANALAAIDQALACAPQIAEMHRNRGDALVGLGRYPEAIASYDAALACDARLADVHKNRGIVLSRLERHAEAAASLERAVTLRPADADAWFNRGNALWALRRYEAALADYDAAIALDPRRADVHVNRGNACFELRRYEAALAAYDAALALDPRHVMAHENRGTACRFLGRHAEAVASFERAIGLNPTVSRFHGLRRHLLMHLGDWREYDADVAGIAQRVERGALATTPFCFLGLCGSARLQRQAAEVWARHEGLLGCELTPAPAPPRHAKIRIGYFSADFREHPVARLIVELIETHARTGFEITGFSFGTDAGDALTRRLERAFDHFIDVRALCDREVALLARSRGLDIAVDLGGFTDGSRPAIFALRAAPLQVSYLGYLGTLGTPTMDYLIADDILVPPEQRAHYTESILYLPSYQANDRQRPIAAREFHRSELGLPPTGFVFCCFNANYKIAPQTFDGWMRILGAVPGSVLFLLAGNSAAETNMRHEAARRGIEPARLVFGGVLPAAEYRARYRAADLFLDTLPYNAGTTASDALWAGTPVLTCLGEAFAGRMAASLLMAIGLPELIARDAAEYQRLAVELATQPARLAEIRQRLAAGRLAAPLFDTLRFTRSLETAFARIHERRHAGLPPADLRISADPA